MKIKKVQIESSQKGEKSKFILNSWVKDSINAKKKSKQEPKATKRYLEVQSTIEFKMLKSIERKRT